MQTQGTKSMWAPIPTEKQDTLIKHPLTERKFSLYKVRTLREAGETKCPKSAENSTLPPLLTNIFFSGLPRCSTALTLLKMPNFSPPHLKHWQFSKMQFEALQLLTYHLFTKTHKSTDTVTVLKYLIQTVCKILLLYINNDKAQNRNQSKSL